MINTADIKDIRTFNVYAGLYCLSTVIRANSMHYYVKDYQGNIRQVTDANDNVDELNTLEKIIEAIKMKYDLYKDK